MLTPEMIAEYQRAMAEGAAKMAGNGGPKTTPIADGANRYRILPNWLSKSPLDPNTAVKFGRHWVKGIAIDQAGKMTTPIRGVTLCNKQTYGQPCPVCDEFWNAKSMGLTKELEDVLKQANAGTRFVVNALHRNSTNPEQVIPLELPYGVAQELFGDGKGSQGVLLQWMAMTQRALPLDLQNGTDVIIRKTGKGIATQYKVEMCTDVSQPVPPSVLDHLIDLDAFVAKWKHTAEDETKAIAGIREIAQAAMAGVGMSQQVWAQPVAHAAPVAQGATQPIATTPPWTADPITADAFVMSAPPAPAPAPAVAAVPAVAAPPAQATTNTVTTGSVQTMSIEDITALLAASGMTLPPSTAAAVAANV